MRRRKRRRKRREEREEREEREGVWREGGETKKEPKREEEKDR